MRHRAQIRDAPVAHLELEPMLRAKAKEQQARKPESVLTTLSKQDEPSNTRKEIAKAAGVSEGTVAKAKAVLESGNEELIEEVSTEINTPRQTVKLAVWQTPLRSRNRRSNGFLEDG